MRISDQQMFGSLLGQLQTTQANLLTTLQQASSGKRVNSPADDPAAFGRIVTNKAALAQMGQWLTNIQSGSTRLQLADSTLSSATNLVAQAKDVALSLQSNVNDANTRAAGAAQVKQLLLELQQLANTAVNGQALFTGTSTNGRATGTTLSVPVTITSGSTDTLQVSVDGTASGTITLPAGSYTGTAAAAMLETQINADPALSAAGKRVTVSFENGQLVIASGSSGAESTVTVTGGTAQAALGFNGGSTTTGADPYALQATATAAAANTGDATISQGRVQDATKATLNDYLIKFGSASTFSVYNVSAPVTVAAAPANTGQASVANAAVTDPTALTLDTYQIQFTSNTQYTVTDTTTGTVVSSGNAYQSGSAMTFDGLGVVLQNGPNGGPQAGDTFTVSLSPTTVLANQPYTSGSAIAFDGLSVTLTSGATGPASGDRYAVTTGIQYQGNSGLQQIQIGTGDTVKTNLPGNQVFSGPTTDLFASLKNLLTALQGNDSGGITQAIGALDQSVNQATVAQAEVGAIASRLNTTQGDLTTAQQAVTQALSQDQDADITQVLSKLASQQYAVQAADAAIAKILQTSLLQYLQ